jgi:DNA-binding IclR family transcriptional regulator
METTVVKGLKVLEALAGSDGTRSLTDLANQCGISKSNAHRLLRTLEACGYVRRGADGRTYQATLRVWELGIRVFSRLDFRAVAVPHLHKLAKVTEETVHLSMCDRDEVIYLDKVDSIHAVRTYVDIGDRAPLYCSATGKAMLAHMPDETIRRIGGNLKRFTKNTVTSLSKLLADLERIRQQGHSVTCGEWRAGVLGIGRAVRSPSGQVIGAIGVAGPEERMRRSKLSRYADAVLEACSNIESDLGFGASAATSLPSGKHDVNAVAVNGRKKGRVNGRPAASAHHVERQRRQTRRASV